MVNGGSAAAAAVLLLEITFFFRPILMNSCHDSRLIGTESKINLKKKAHGNHEYHKNCFKNSRWNCR